jgi:integrase
VRAWIATHPNRNDPRAFFFPSSAGTAFSVGNYLKRYLKPLAEEAGVPNVTHQAFRRTSSTHMQNHATVKDMQRHLRHTDPQTTLKHYAKVIPESLRSAVAALDAQISGILPLPKLRALASRNSSRGLPMVRRRTKNP